MPKSTSTRHAKECTYSASWPAQQCPNMWSGFILLPRSAPHDPPGKSDHYEDRELVDEGEITARTEVALSRVRTDDSLSNYGGLKCEPHHEPCPSTPGSC